MNYIIEVVLFRGKEDGLLDFCFISYWLWGKFISVCGLIFYIFLGELVFIF